MTSRIFEVPKGGGKDEADDVVAKSLHLRPPESGLGPVAPCQGINRSPVIET
jgi:hypothetical protein